MSDDKTFVTGGGAPRGLAPRVKKFWRKGGARLFSRTFGPSFAFGLRAYQLPRSRMGRVCCKGSMSWWMRHTAIIVCPTPAWTVALSPMRFQQARGGMWNRWSKYEDSGSGRCSGSRADG